MTKENQDVDAKVKRRNLFSLIRSAWKAEGEEAKTRKFYRAGIGLVGSLVVAVVLFVVVTQVLLFRDRHNRERDVLAGPKVRVEAAVLSPSTERVTLTGETRPFASVTLYAKVSGYLGEIRVDKGDEVKKNQVIAIVNSPETTKAYQGALADAQNKRAIGNRMKELRERNLVSPQEAEQAISDADVSEAKLETAAAMKGYEILRAPFDGVVTARFIDAGTLVQNAENSQTSAQPVVTVSKTDQLRIYVYVDQKYAFYIEKGAPAEIFITERPELKLKATITRTSGQLDPRTRMMLVEVDYDNVKKDIVAGSFVNIALDIKIPPFPQVPVESVMLKGDKAYVPLVTSDGTVHFQEVTTGDNDGKHVRIVAGLKGGEQVALDLGNSVADGSHVRAVASEPEKPKESKEPKKN